MISKKLLENEYVNNKKSVAFIAQQFNCSQGKVNYWLNKYSINKRAISEAVYIQANPLGNPFIFKHPSDFNEWFLFGLGLGIFWGEGNKVNNQAIRLGNTDPDLIWYFLRFLNEVYQIKQERLRFGLQIFEDINEQEALNYWCQKLKIKPSQFQTTATVIRLKRGTYTKKCKFGVLTVYFSNTKLRATIMAAIDELRLRKSVFEVPLPM